MLKKIALFLFLLVLTVSYGCSIDHRVADDYRQYLANNKGSSNLPKTDFEADYSLTDFTKKHKYEFRSATVGYANLWIVEFGKILDETLKSPDIQKSFGQLSLAHENLENVNSLVLFDLESYEFSDFGAHVSLRIALFESGNKIFDKVYSVDGKTQGSKMFFAGVFGMKNAIQQSTKLAIDQVFRDFIEDVDNTPL
jgi:hypothetical protein